MSFFRPSRLALAFALAFSAALVACDDADFGSADDAADDGSGGASPSSSTSAVVDCAAEAESALAVKVDVVRRRIVASNAQDWDTWESLHTPGATRTAPELEAPIEGAAGMRAAIEQLFVTFPDYHLELVEAFGEGDRLMARIHTTATMDGPMYIDGVEIPPTGNGFEQDWVAVLTFDGDRISAIDEFYDNYGTMIQLGLAQ